MNCLFDLSIEEAKEAFKDLDHDSNGGISLQEFLGSIEHGLKAATGSTEGLSDEIKGALKTLFGLMDADSSGEVEKDEYESVVDLVFEHADANDNGKVDFCELVEGFKQWYESLNKEHDTGAECGEGLTKK
jgi:Ca2+-binding EF-hand superfamily protein